MSVAKQSHFQTCGLLQLHEINLAVGIKPDISSPKSAVVKPPGMMRFIPQLDTFVGTLVEVFLVFTSFQKDNTVGQSCKNLSLSLLHLQYLLSQVKLIVNSLRGVK